MVPTYTNSFILTLSGRVKPKWWREFTKEWRNLSDAKCNEDYYLNEKVWLCGCPSFRVSRFFSCNHIVKRSTLGSYQDLVRSRMPPFISWKTNVYSRFPLLGTELVSAQETVVPCVKGLRTSREFSTGSFAFSCSYCVKSS